MWIFLSRMTIQQDGSNKPHTKCQLHVTPWPLLARLTWSCLRQIFEITENDQNIYKPWIGSPDDYLYTVGMYHSWIEFSSFAFHEQIYEKRAN